MTIRPNALVIALLAAAGSAHAGNYVSGIIPATANIYGAGHTEAPGPGGGGAGVLPTGFDLKSMRGEEPAGNFIQFAVVSGEVSGQGKDPANFGEADGSPNGSTDVDNYGGLSGIGQDKRTMFLVGVFLGPDEPTGKGPIGLDFSKADQFDMIAPEIGQTFWVGDGFYTDENEGDGGRPGPRTIYQQSFVIPEGATRFFLGFAQAGPDGNGLLPGGFDDNFGELYAEFHIVDVPAPGAAMGLGGLALARVSRRRR